MQNVIQQIQVNNPSPRKAAILEWAQSENPIMLGFIAHLYATAPDDLVQQLAQLADDRYQDMRRHTYKIRQSYQPFDQALLHLDEAMRSYLTDDQVKASDYLCQAMALHPAWKDDPVVADFAGFVLEMQPQEAMQILLDPANHDAFSMATGARWWRLREAAGGNVTWRGILLYTLGYSLIYVINVVLLWILITQIWFERLVLVLSANNASLAKDVRIVAQFDIVLIPIMLIIVLAFVLDVMLRALSFHLLAAGVFRGTGGLANLLRRMIPIHATIAMFASVGLFIILTVTVNGEQFLGFDGTLDSAAISPLVLLPIFAAVPIMLFVFAQLIVEMYALSFKRTLLTAIVGGVISMMLSLIVFDVLLTAAFSLI